MNVPTGMLANGKVLPGLISASGPDTTTSPTFNPAGAIMYLFSPSAYTTNAMYADLFGSYSTVATFAGIPSLFLLKSIILYFLLAPPPWCLTVILPCAFLPPVFFKETKSDFSYFFLMVL